MSHTKIYLMTLNSPSRRGLRLWTGKSIHTLRHCSARQIGSALAEMQRNVDDLQADMKKLAQATGQWTAKAQAPLKIVRDDGIRVFTPNNTTRGQAPRAGAPVRNVGQRGDSRGRGSRKG